jgi:arylsulfatase A-like enzyme
MSKKITRRQFVETGTALALGGVISSISDPTARAAKSESASRPNVLLIHTDEHRIECLGAYGNPDVRTPNIDSLAADGVRYRNSFCPYPVCTPSRYSVLSGLYVHEHRGWTNHSTLPPGTSTFASILRDAGYKTKAVGKMHFTPTYLNLGFDELVLAEQNGPGRWDDDYHRELRVHGLVDRNDLEDQLQEYRKDARPEYWETFGAMPSNLPEEFHSTRWIGDRAAETLTGWGSSGHLLMVGFIKPHHPFDPPREWCEAYDPAKLALLPGWTNTCFPRDLALSKGYFPHEKLTEPAVRRVMAYYYATIEQIDQRVGRMLDILKRKGLYDNALVIFTGDHGEYMGFHHMLLKGNYMYDPVVKVPLIIKYPHGEQRSTVSDALVSNVDVAPTIIGQADVEPAEQMRGRDLAQAREERRIVFAEDRHGSHAMARSKTRKLILCGQKSTSLFFDLERDPLETTNLFENPAYQSEIQTYANAINQWRSIDELPKVYLDEDAPRINQPNVPALRDGHREEMGAYFARKMQEA